LFLLLKNSKLATSLVLSFVTLFGCYSKVGDFTLVSTRNSNMNNWEKHVAGKVTGKSCTNIFLFIPFTFKDIKEAIEDAIDKSNEKTGSATANEGLLDVNVYSSWWTLLLYTRSCYEVKGIPANSWGRKNNQFD
jgi:hypothetical protein